MALELLISLLENGVTFKEISPLISGNEFVACFAEAFYATQTCQYQVAIRKFTDLADKYPGNVLVLTHLGLTFVKNQDFSLASGIYQKIKKQFPFETCYVDGQAIAILNSKSSLVTLDRLHSQVSFASHFKECRFVECAGYLEKRLFDKAAEMFEQLAKDYPRYVLAHQYHGYASMKLGEYGVAANSYRVAYRINRDVTTYQGLVNCYLKLHKYNEAKMTAKEALALFPLSAVALTLAGQSMRDSPKAKDYFEKAFALDEKNLECLLVYSQYLRESKGASEAIALLNRAHLYSAE